MQSKSHQSVIEKCHVSHCDVTSRHRQHSQLSSWLGLRPEEAAGVQLPLHRALLDFATTNGAGKIHMEVYSWENHL
jgi:hypothetical protein